MASSLDPIAVFPLGMVLAPTTVVPLRVFEPRYVSLLADVAEGDNRFGVVLINRGSEVGEVHANPELSRANIGTMARIVEVASEGNHTTILIQGEERFKVDSWLKDDPYPSALVTPFGLARNTLVTSGSDVQSDEALLEKAVHELTSLISLAKSLGTHVQELPHLGEDLAHATDLLCAIAPLAVFDQQRLLESPGPNERLALLCSLVSDLRAFVEMQREANS